MAGAGDETSEVPEVPVGPVESAERGEDGRCTMILDSEAVTHGADWTVRITVKADTIEKCPRCGSKHENLFLQEFINPQSEFTHWASCPTTSQPIICKYALVVQP